MTHARISALLAVALLLGTGCSKNWNDPAYPLQTPNPIQPLALGNTWTYVDSNFTQAGVFVSRDSTRMTLTDAYTAQDGSKKYPLYVRTRTDLGKGLTYDDRVIFGTSMNGLYVWGVLATGFTGTVVYEGTTPLVRYPVALDDTWYAPDIREPADSLFKGLRPTQQWLCKNPSASFATPAGVFTAVQCHVEVDSSATEAGVIVHHLTEHDRFYALGVGYVGAVEKFDHRITSSQRLTHYTLH